MRQIIESAQRATKADLEAWETGIRVSVLAAGAKALTPLVNSVGAGRRDEPVACACGSRMESNGQRRKDLLTILGDVPYSRAMYVCQDCGSIRYPADEELDVVDTTRSPGVRRMMTRAGNSSTFKEGATDLQIYAEIKVSPKDVERVAEKTGEDMENWAREEREQLWSLEEPPGHRKTTPVQYVCYDGTGVPMVKKELKGRKGKQKDGTALTREAKLGCVFTQTTTDENGRPIRDPDSTSFVGAIETSEEFGGRIYAEAVRRGLWDAKEVVVLGDGAEWIWNVANEHFPNATQIIDLYHAKEHVSDLCKLLFSPQQSEVKKYRKRWWSYLKQGKIVTITKQATELMSAQPEERREEAQKEIAYLNKNAERMRYLKFRRRGLFIGSGVVEAGCKSVIGHRLKQSGMEWSLRGANAMISLRCSMASNRFDDYWEQRAEVCHS